LLLRVITRRYIGSTIFFDPLFVRPDDSRLLRLEVCFYASPRVIRVRSSTERCLRSFGGARAPQTAGSKTFGFGPHQ